MESIGISAAGSYTEALKGIIYLYLQNLFMIWRKIFCKKPEIVIWVSLPSPPGDNVSLQIMTNFPELSDLHYQMVFVTGAFSAE